MTGQRHKSVSINRNHLLAILLLATMRLANIPGKLLAHQQPQPLRLAGDAELAVPVDMITKWLLSNKFISPAKLAADLQNVEVEKLKLSSGGQIVAPVAMAAGEGFVASNVDSPIASAFTSASTSYKGSSCQLVQIAHLLHQDGCHPKAIASFACSGTCPSYVQTSSSKFWQHERSCSCCQQAGLQEATFTLDCPSLEPPYRKVKTYAPVECLCRACTDLGRENLKPQELVDALAGDTMANNEG